MSNEFREEMKQLLLNIPGARLVSGGKEVLIRCRYCPDSKDPRSAHMYISLPDNDNVMLHNCYKCHTSGIVTHTKLLEWGVYDSPETLVKLSKYNKHVLSLDKNKKFRDTNVYRINNAFISDNDISRVKLKYINSRLGLNLSYNDLLQNKIVLNLKDLLDSNNIQNITRNIDIINQLDFSFLGFLSQDNAFLNMRNLSKKELHPSINKRYINYNIFGKVDNTLRYYTIPTGIDLTLPQRIKLHIAEGPFDILSIYYNLRHQESHSIYSSILGSSYKSILLHFILNMKLINLEVHMYIDNDIDNYVVYDVKKLLDVFQIPLYLHRNMKSGEKDFGVTLDRIQEQIQRV